jgi:hypothetical protein
MNKLIANKTQKLFKEVVATGIAVTMLFSTAFAERM